MKKGIKINCEQGEIFEYVTNYRNVNFLLDEFLHFEPKFSGSIQIGHFYQARGSVAVVNFEIPYLVTHFTPDTLMVLQSQEQIQSRVIWEVQPGENNLPLLCLQVDIDLDTSRSPIFKPFLSNNNWLSHFIITQIRSKQQSLVINALLRAKRSLELQRVVSQRH